METHRDDVIVIFAGYTDKMQAFLDRNPGMASRIAFNVEFEDYTTEELCDIAKLMLSRKSMRATDAAIEKLGKICENAGKDPCFGNGRFVRRMIDDAIMNLAQRMSKFAASELTTEFITTLEEQDISELQKVKKQPARARIGFV